MVEGGVVEGGVVNGIALVVAMQLVVAMELSVVRFGASEGVQVGVEVTTAAGVVFSAKLSLVGSISIAVGSSTDAFSSAKVGRFG